MMTTRKNRTRLGRTWGKVGKVGLCPTLVSDFGKFKVETCAREFAQTLLNRTELPRGEKPSAPLNQSPTYIFLFQPPRPMAARMSNGDIAALAKQLRKATKAGADARALDLVGVLAGLRHRWLRPL